MADVRAAWGEFLTSFGGQYAVSACYNNQYAGTAGPCYRITPDGECARLRGSGISARYGINRLSGAHRIPLDQVHRDLDRWHWQVDRKLFGTRFNLLPEDQRTAFVGFVEHLGSNTHIHLTWRVPEARLNEFAIIASKAWSRIGPAATIDVQSIRDNGWGHYMVKDQKVDTFEDAALFVSSRRTPA